MSIIANTLKGNEKIHFLLEIDLEGRKLRYSTENIVVPYSDGTDLLFKAKLKSNPSIMSSFDFRSFRYSTSSFKVDIINDERLQDLEVRTNMDYATAKIWLWCKGLDWSNIVNKPIFSGSVRKENHDEYWYSVTLIDFVSTKYDFISDDTFTGTPAEVVEGIINGHTSLDIDQIDYGSFKDLDTLLSSLSLDVLIDERVDTFDVIDRVLGQCRCARTQRAGKISTVLFDYNALPLHYIKFVDLETKFDGVKRTPFELICNDLSISYGPVAGAWGTTITRDRTNSELCKQSYSVYGPQPQRQLLLADCDGSADADFCIDRYLNFFAFRHEIITLDLRFHKAWDMLEGDVAEVTLEEGPSIDGNGWVDERFMLIEKSFMPSFVRTKWWRIGT